MDEQGFSLSGLLQQASSLTTGYLSRRIDIDLATRLANAQTPAQATDQTPIALYNPAQQTVAGINLGIVLPLVGVALVAVLLLRR